MRLPAPLSRHPLVLAVTLALSAAALQASAADAPAGTRLLRFPDVCGDRIAFTYAGDLWTVPVTGGTATRITAGPGLERSARFSPDCRQIAFTGQYDGNDEVYVVPASGGQPRQLTYYPNQSLPPRWGFDNQVYGWSPDGTRVLFRSARYSWDPALPKLFSVTADGGLAQPLPMPTAGTGRYSPDGKRLVYAPKFRDFRSWDRYHGGWAQSLYIYDFAARSARKVISDGYSDRDPVWIGASIYYVSDRDNHGNLYRYDTASGKTVQLTHHARSDARWASGDAAGRIVYEFDGGLRLYDTGSGQDRAVTVHVPSDLPSLKPRMVKVADDIEDAELSPNGKRALVTARGELFDMPLQHGITRDLTHTPGAHERAASWSRDGKHMAYISDQGGHEAIWVRSGAEQSDAHALTGQDYGRLYRPLWSPDGKHIAFVDSANHLRLVDTSGKVVEVAHDERRIAQDYAWSPGGHYLAYTLQADNREPALFVYDLASGHSHRASAAPFNAYGPAFSPDGKYLYFLSEREWTPQISGVEWDYASNRSTEIYALALRKGIASPFPVRNDPATGEAGKSGGEDGHDEHHNKAHPPTPGAVDDRIDFDGLSQRLARVPVPADNYSDLSVTPEGLLYTLHAAPFYGRQGAFKTRLMRFSFEDRKAKKLAEDNGLGGGYSLSADGHTVLYASGDGLKQLALKGGEAKPEDVDTGGLYAWVDPPAEFAEIFREVWRRYRDYFYAPGMNGYDWAALRRKYAAQLPYVGDRTDLNYLMGEMIGELSNSHAYVSGGDLGLPQRPHVDLLGASFALDTHSGHYRIAHIFTGDNAEARYRSPLTQLGVDVHEGDYLLAINGRPLRATDNPYALLQAAPGQPLELTVNRRPDMTGARTVLIQPLDSEHDLVYYDWVKANRDYVARKSGGTIGYLHIPDMGADGIREFIKWYYPQIHKQGLVVDVRGNGGGNVSPMIIERLSRKLLGLSYTRGSTEPDTYPRQTFTGYMAALADGTTASDGDIFSQMFKRAGLGPLIGTRTWGGVIGISDWGPLIDGGHVNVPQFFAAASPKGELQIEGEGVTPDQVVPEEVGKQLRGDDPQLDAAISYLQGRIKANPPTLPTRPADPDKAPPGMRPGGADFKD